MIKQWLASYQPQTAEAAEQALREIMQEIALAGLNRGGFFKEAAFYGGTALRLFYGLDRFSEDLDFSLLAPNEQFSIANYLENIESEFAAVGMKVSIKQKPRASNIESAFLKSNTIWTELTLENTTKQIGLSNRPSLKIKIEVDTNPPIEFETEDKLLLKPYSFYVNCFTISNLFAGKMHALLFRRWKNRVKGRDWYDLEWYIKNNIQLNLKHLCVRAKDSGDWEKSELTKTNLMKLLEAKINAVNMKMIKEDITRFIPNPGVLDIWSTQYFKDLIKHIKI
ncbi:MAG: nucleotidyl transferase AbiEii/AbiGii toxin family protein [Chitinophagaceae bacterium]|nr:nucleotidyl transferase AbiEii/AbiGii toxin family protein [Chitinophagaceae bacterium]